MIKSIISFIKKEVVLTVAWVLAIASMFVVHPSAQYKDYIDWRTIGILWGLMVIMEGLKNDGFFDYVGNKLLKKTKNTYQLALVLVFLCFFFSMLITNDVALITFVPFAVLMLKKCKGEEFMIPVIVLQTIAANLGSMLTPIGNPQNLYLYTQSGVGIFEFIGWMMPYTLIAGILIAGILIAFSTILLVKNRDIDISFNKKEGNKPDKMNWWIFLLLFILALLVVSQLVKFYILVIAVFIAMLIVDRKILTSVDYSLIFTFIGFFIFTGNVGNIGRIDSLMQVMVADHEIVFGVGLSQIISNVPATLLLSGFTDNLKALLIGVNFGGLGTLIASMASLISYKIFANEYNDKKGKYFIWFTLLNIIFLAILLSSLLAFRI